ncbi:MAG: hypothetical protein ACLRSW_02485 [Christensenellaceae bacterium]
MLTNKWAGIPLFLLILFAIFHCTFSEDFLFLGAVIKPFGAWAEEIGGTTAGGVFFTGGLNSPGVILANALGLLTDTLTGLAQSGLEAANAAPWAVSLVCDGILGGLFSCFLSCRKSSFCSSSSLSSRTVGIWRALRLFSTAYSAASASRAERLCP